VLFGIESGDDGILKTIKKGITLEEARRGVRMATDAGLKVFNSFIFGLPGESPDTARKSMAFAQELDHEYGAKYAFHVLAPLPGTELYVRAGDYGLRILSRNWARYDANQAITETATMGPQMVEETMASYDRAVEQAWEDIRCQAEAGDAQCSERLGGKESQEFVWSLLQGDVIEGVGRVAAATALNPSDAEAELARRVSRKLALPLEVVQEQMGKLVEGGLLQLEPGGSSPRWRWSDSLRLGLAREVLPVSRRGA
jgi:radical SAM superfamily enzyme YgiQ (UPF0313 family)